MKKLVGSAFLTVVAVCFLPLIVYDRVKSAGASVIKRWKDYAGPYNLR